MATETSERLKALTKAADDCAKVRSEMEDSNKAHLIAVNEVKSKIDSVQSGARQALNTVEKDLNTKITTCTGTVESLKTELTIKIDTNDDAMKEKIQGLRQEVEEAEGKMTETRPAAQTQILSSADKAP